jgi:hypothetical protein
MGGVSVAQTLVVMGEEATGGVSFSFAGSVFGYVTANPVRGYLICGAYQLLNSQQHASLEAVKDLIWHKKVLLKVLVFSWRLLRDRLQTKANLVI